MYSVEVRTMLHCYPTKAPAGPSSAGRVKTFVAKISSIVNTATECRRIDEPVVPEQ